jgi:hypothetical protein
MLRSRQASTPARRRASGVLAHGFLDAYIVGTLASARLLDGCAAIAVVAAM